MRPRCGMNRRSSRARAHPTGDRVWRNRTFSSPLRHRELRSFAIALCFGHRYSQNMVPARRGIVAKAIGLLATASALLVGNTQFVVPLAGAAPSKNLSCTACASSYRPLSFHIVTIYVTTKPEAKVSGIVTSGGSSWSMIPTAPANRSGRARLNQKISAVSISTVSQVTVRVSLKGLVGLCYTQFKPVMYTPGSY